MANNPTHDHHFVPVFYLKNWILAGHDRLVEYKIRRNSALPRWTYPKGTGYQKHLYSSTDDSVQSLEDAFLMPADGFAADAMKVFFSSTIRSGMEWTTRQRSSWTRFMMSMLLRHPEDVADFAKIVEDDWVSATPEMQRRYAAIRSPDLPERIEDWLLLHKNKDRERARLNWMRALIDHEGIGRRINRMHWSVFDLSSTSIPLMTSDRPVITEYPLSTPKSYIMLPLSPTKLFVAVETPDLADMIFRQRPNILAKEVNKEVVRNARIFAFAADERHNAFVKKHFGQASSKSLFAKLAEHRAERRLDGNA